MAVPSTVAPDRIVTVTPDKAAKALMALMLAGVPAYLHGHPGIGKSDVVAQVCREAGRPMIDTRAAGMDPLDARGAMEIVDHRTVWTRPALWPTDPGYVIFFDEFNRAPLSVQNVLMQAMNTGMIGEHPLPPDTYIILAGNDDDAGVQRTSGAMNNRAAHLYVVPDVPVWCAWAAANGIHPLVYAFHRWRQQNPTDAAGNPRPNVFSTFDKHAHAYPTPRAWAMVSKVMHATPDPDVRLPVVAGIVGEAAALEFLAFADLYRKLPNLDHIRLNPATAPVPTDVSAQYAVSAAIAARMTEDTMEAYLTYLDRLPAAEYSVFAVKDATARDPGLATTEAFGTWAVKHQGVLN